jgi:uncharacterized membrane protein
VWLSSRLVPGPTYLLPALEVLLLIGLVAADPNRLTAESRDLRLPSLVLIGLVATANGIALVRLIDRLVGGGGSGRQLLTAAAGVWLTNVVVFGLAYWEVDRGGPLGRAGARPAPTYPDLWWPQDGDAKAACPPGWEPVFVDYLFVSLTSSLAFSPTDTMPLTARAKLLMGSQSLISLLTVGLVAARAVNILR